MAEPNRSWSYIPPAWSGTQVEGTGLLPIGRYKMPDGSEQVSFGLPQPMLDAVRSLGYASGRDQDPAAAKGYVSQNALMKGGMGLAESAMVGSLGASAPAGALRAGMARKGGGDFMGLPLDENGLVTLYHATKTPEAAASIRQSRQLRSSGEPDVYLSTAKAGTGYGDNVVGVKVDPRRLELDDEFPDGRMDFRINTGKPGGATDIDLAANAKPSAGVSALMSTARKNADLDPSQAARAQRALDMGFEDSPYFRGLQKEYDPNSKRTQWFTSSQENANEFANMPSRQPPRGGRPQVFNAFLRPGKTHEIDMGGRWMDNLRAKDLPDDLRAEFELGNPERLVNRDAVAAKARDLGYDSLKFRNMIDGMRDNPNARPSDVVAILNNAGIRNTEAMFDPARINETDPFAAHPLAGAVPLAWKQPQEEQPRQHMISDMDIAGKPETLATRNARLGKERASELLNYYRNRQRR